jgi:hypothetical protein
MKRLLIVIFFISVCSGFSFTQFGNGKWWIEPGEMRFILQYRANVREQPSLDSPVIAVLSLGNIVEIIERSTYEVINDYNGEWYKIKCKDVIGYTFCGNLASERLIVDIDNNGINDYFSFRSVDSYYASQDVRRDIFIFINNQRISTAMLNTYSSNYELEEPYFGRCEFEERDDHVLMKLSQWGNISADGNNYAFKNIYKINADGTIEFMDWELGNIRGRDYRKTRTTESDLQRPHDGDYWEEWYTLEAYEKYHYRYDQVIEKIFISADGQLWLKTWYKGK